MTHQTSVYMIIQWTLFRNQILQQNIHVNYEYKFMKSWTGQLQ